MVRPISEYIKLPPEVMTSSVTGVVDTWMTVEKDTVATSAVVWNVCRAAAPGASAPCI